MLIYQIIYATFFSKKLYSVGITKISNARLFPKVRLLSELICFFQVFITIIVSIYYHIFFSLLIKDLISSYISLYFSNIFEHFLLAEIITK